MEVNKFIGDVTPDTVLVINAIDSEGGQHRFKTHALFRLGEERTVLYVEPMTYSGKYLNFKHVTTSFSCVIDEMFYLDVANEVTLARVNGTICHRIVCTRPLRSRNRREFIRMGAEFPGEISILETDQHYACQTHDISCSGMSVILPSVSELDKGATAVISFRDKESGQRYIVYAVAMHVTAVSEDMERVGFKFDQEYLDVNTLVASLQRGEIKRSRI